MLRKILLTTSALIVAGSLALASPHGALRPAHTLAQLQQLHRQALEKKGMILDRKGVPIAILRSPPSATKNATNGAAVQPSLLPPGKRDSYSNFGKSKNALYLFWFGWFVRNAASHEGPYSGSFCYSYSGSQCVNRYKYKYSLSDTQVLRAAQPFSGLKSASSISLGLAGGKGKAAIHANHIATTSSPCATPSGPPSCPGHPIKGASGAFSSTGSSAVVTVRFSPVKLRKNAKYWLVVSAPPGNNLVWFGEADNWTRPPTGEDANYIRTEVMNSTYATTRYGYHNTSHTSSHQSSNGWIHTASFTFGEWQGAFSINFVPP